MGKEIKMLKEVLSNQEMIMKHLGIGKPESKENKSASKVKKVAAKAPAKTKAK